MSYIISCLVLYLVTTNCVHYFILFYNSILLSIVQPRVLERHFHDLQKKYGAVLAVDLVNTVSILHLNFELTLVL